MPAETTSAAIVNVVPKIADRNRKQQDHEPTDFRPCLCRAQAPQRRKDVAASPTSTPDRPRQRAGQRGASGRRNCAHRRRPARHHRGHRHDGGRTPARSGRKSPRSCSITDDKSHPRPSASACRSSRGDQHARQARQTGRQDLQPARHRPEPARQLAWSSSRRISTWARAVVDGLRGVHPELERLFDTAWEARPHP